MVPGAAQPFCSVCSPSTQADEFAVFSAHTGRNPTPASLKVTMLNATRKPVRTRGYRRNEGTRRARKSLCLRRMRAQGFPRTSCAAGHGRGRSGGIKEHGPGSRLRGMHGTAGRFRCRGIRHHECGGRRQAGNAQSVSDFLFFFTRSFPLLCRPAMCPPRTTTARICDPLT